MKTKIYEYFINFSYPNGNGTMGIDRKEPIKSVKDIEATKNYIRGIDGVPDDAIITDFKLMRTYKTTLTQ